MTEEGIHGVPTHVSSKTIIDAYKKTGVEVFHLMGGAPAYYINHWPELINDVDIFHSDMLLVEQHYDGSVLKDIRMGLYAVSIKSPEIYTEAQINMLFKNLEKVVSSGIDFYLTITGEDTALSDDVLNCVPKNIADGVIRIKIRDYKSLGKEA